MRILLLMIPLFVCAGEYGLRTLIDHAGSYNALIEARSMNVKAKAEEMDAAKRAYWPALDVGVSHSVLSPKYLVSPGQVSSAFAQVSVELYDGGRKRSLLQAKTFEHEASLFEKKAFEKSVTLEIVNHYYTIMKLRSTLHALGEQDKELKAQIDRVKKFLQTGLATSEEVAKLQAVYENNRYMIENARLALQNSEENLQLRSGLKAEHLRYSRFREPDHIRFEPFETVKILAANAKAMHENTNAVNSGYKPQVILSDTYSRTHYDDMFPAGPGFDPGSFLIDHQNNLTLSVSMRLFDNGKMKKEAEALKYRRLALLSESSYRLKEQKMNFSLAKKTLKTVRAKRRSAASELKAAKSTYHSVRKKFEAGVADNIAYLDALTQMTLAESQYKETLYDYEIAKSIYYYYAGKDPKEFIK